MQTHIIHNGGYTLAWSRKCPHYHHWFALKKSPESTAEQVVAKCQYCEHDFHCTTAEWTALSKYDPRRLYSHWS